MCNSPNVFSDMVVKEEMLYELIKIADAHADARKFFQSLFLCNITK
jgi:hypothetical protein